MICSSNLLREVPASTNVNKSLSHRAKSKLQIHIGPQQESLTLVGNSQFVVQLILVIVGQLNQMNNDRKIDKLTVSFWLWFSILTC